MSGIYGHPGSPAYSKPRVTCRSAVLAYSRRVEEENAFEVGSFRESRERAALSRAVATMELDDAYMENEHEDDEEITQEDAWAVITSYFEEKGLVRQQLDSFDEFIQNTMQEIVGALWISPPRQGYMISRVTQGTEVGVPRRTLRMHHLLRYYKHALGATTAPPA